MEETIVSTVKNSEEYLIENSRLVIERDNLRKLLSESKANHQKDIETIGNALIEEAEQRDFCSDYDNFIDELNEKLTIDLPVRKKTFQVTVEITRTISTSVTVEVECSHEEDVNDLINEDDSIWQDELPSSMEYWDEDDESVEVTRVREL